ncbi:MAG: tetratricopeptide repeat protein, partial [Candidatus Methanofastidiosia archaeon]
KAIELNPENFAAFNNRGLAYSDLNQYEKAIQDYNKAIELNPENFAAFYNRGLAYSDLNQYEKAIQDYNKAIELDPEYAAAFNNRGNRYSDLNQYEKAIQDYNKAIELDPEYAAAFYNRAISYSQMEYHKKAAKDFKTAGILFFKSKRVNDSIRAFSMCFDLREKIKHDDIIYCGLLLYLLTSDENIPTELKALNIPPEQLKNISACIKKLIIEDFKNIDIFQKEGTDKILEALEKLAKDHDQNL